MHLAKLDQRKRGRLRSRKVVRGQNLDSKHGDKTESEEVYRDRWEMAIRPGSMLLDTSREAVETRVDGARLLGMWSERQDPMFRLNAKVYLRPPPSL
jgi:hypothetical protein